MVEIAVKTPALKFGSEAQTGLVETIPKAMVAKLAKKVINIII